MPNQKNTRYQTKFLYLSVVSSLLLLLGACQNANSEVDTLTEPEKVSNVEKVISSEPEVVAQQVIIAFQKGSDKASIDKSIQDVNGKVIRQLYGAESYLVELPEGSDIDLAIKNLERVESVKYVEKNSIQKN